ncbi:MAG: alpha/beta fold hydrolase [Woeseiaceae bacterium]|nr:alpha/beta fold hydrolase [Woeseiaceae bacterium]
MVSAKELDIPARDGLRLRATLFAAGGTPERVVIVGGATAVPRRFYRHFATALAEAGFAAITFDYRGTGGSRPASLRGFEATATDWALSDMTGIVDWAVSELNPARLFMVGHSFGGQTAGLLDNGHRIDGLVTVSAQSGYWRIQGGEQKLVVGLHVHLTLPLLAHLFGYVPWSRIGSAEDLPKGVALQWARWCRDPRYLLGDESLPLARYAEFRAPVLAYSIDDDKWGRPQAVNAMMAAYPNVERRHIEPRERGLASLGHVGYFRPEAAGLWPEVIDWFNRAPQR